jgi:hypothetical protein
MGNVPHDERDQRRREKGNQKASILPKDVLVNVQQQTPGNLDPDEWRVLVDLVRLIKASAPEGSQALPTEIVPAIEETVRAHFARPVETIGE